MKKLFIAVFAVVLLGSCNQANKEHAQAEATDTSDTLAEYIPIDATTDTTDMHQAQNSLDVIGIYKGTLPCADCEGIQTEIELKADSTYRFKSSYLGKGDGQVNESSGTYVWLDGSRIELQDIDGGPQKYFVGENTLTALDMDGNKITGELAAHYILKK